VISSRDCGERYAIELGDNGNMTDLALPEAALQVR